MATYKLDKKKFIKLSEITFTDIGLQEKELQQFIIHDTSVLEEDLFVISSEFGDWEESKRKIDILCLDKNANLVIIELKRTEDGGHMELQSIRYAAMVANMTFDKTVDVFQRYREKIDSKIEHQKDPKEEILEFLGWGDVNEDEFGNDARIILVSANFSKEITTSVLWLIERDIDIKCIRIKPQKNEKSSEVYLDIQQIIPLPEATDYQVRLKEKSAEQRQARKENTRDYSKFDITIKGEKKENLNKREAVYFVISESVKSGIKPQDLTKLTKKGRWIWVDKECSSQEEFEKEIKKTTQTYDSSRWFNTDDQLLVYEGKTYSFSNQHAGDMLSLVNKIFKTYPKLEGEIKKTQEF